MSDVDARYLGLTANQLAKIATNLKAENAKLRKLVGELMPTARIAAQHGINVGKLADQERRARELRVEVDG